MITNLPKGLLWEIQSQREHCDRLTLIMFRSLKCSKSQNWLHIYEAKMHLLLILGSRLNVEALCSRRGNFEAIRNLFLAVEKHFPSSAWTVCIIEQNQNTWRHRDSPPKKHSTGRFGHWRHVHLHSWCGDLCLLSVFSVAKTNTTIYTFYMQYLNCRKSRKRSTVDSVQDSKLPVPV